MEKYTNDLANETSPYLLQHAHNPVNWVAWSEDVFDRAKSENKMVLISIGYSACHWCHVMEHECFEDEEVATLMNKFFINVKVDREERPDVDQVYMTAVQLMTQKGGWPLNCFTLPDGRPIYGGTYFPKEQWMHILKSLHHNYTNEYDKIEEYAKNLHKGIISSELITKPQSEINFEESKLTELIQRWSKSFDMINGGTNLAPKFPLPSNYEFLLDYSINTNNQKIRDYVELSLDKMALGGIYDQIGGGFSRYSVDMLWKVPHFEKMLYDNGQLTSVYSIAYRTYKKPLYKRLVYQSIDWLEREMTDGSGAFYSALDADSEGVEGKFYVWSEKELKLALGDDYEWVKDFYEVNQRGIWEYGNYILLRCSSDTEFQKKMGWTIEELEKNIQRINETLLATRKDRIRPGLDDKCLTSWNAMMLKGLCDAFLTFDEDRFLHFALKNAKWIIQNQIKDDGGLWRNYKDGKSNIDGFLEDYAHTIAAFIALYEASSDEEYLNRAKNLADYTLVHFHEESSKMFYFTPKNTTLITRKMEINDNVIPSSNSVMARNLYYLGKYYHDQNYVNISKQMLANMYDGMEMYGTGYSNWSILLNHNIFGFYEFVVVGVDADDVAKQVINSGIPKSLIVKSKVDSDLPILSDKEINNETLIHVCTEGTCFLPTKSVSEATNKVIQ
jgi:uncharacterized protein